MPNLNLQDKKTEVALSPNRCVRAKEDLIAYIAGIVASDGHLTKNGYGIAITTANKEFTKHILEKLSLLSIKASLYKKSTAYVVEFYNKIFFNMLTEKFCIPRGKKSDILIRSL